MNNKFLVSIMGCAIVLISLCGCNSRSPHVVDPVDNSAIFSRADESYNEYQSAALDLSDFTAQTEKKLFTYRILDRVYEVETKEEKLESKLIGEWNTITKKNWAFMCMTLSNTSALTIDLPFYVDDEYDEYLSNFFSTVNYYEKRQQFMSDIVFYSKTATYYVDPELNVYIKEGDHCYKGDKKIDISVVINNVFFYETTLLQSNNKYDFACSATYKNKTIEIDDLSKYIENPNHRIARKLSISYLIPKNDLISVSPHNKNRADFYLTQSGRKVGYSKEDIFTVTCYESIYSISGENLLYIANESLDISKLLQLFE